jgi:hypothetical protein
MNYEAPDSLLWGLALEPRHGTVLVGSDTDIICWDVKTGKSYVIVISMITIAMKQ